MVVDIRPFSSVRRGGVAIALPGRQSSVGWRHAPVRSIFTQPASNNRVADHPTRYDSTEQSPIVKTAQDWEDDHGFSPHAPACAGIGNGGRRFRYRILRPRPRPKHETDRAVGT